MGRGFTSGGQESVFSAAVCKIQASNRYIESLQAKRSCFPQGARSAVELPLDITCLPFGSRTLN